MPEPSLFHGIAVLIDDEIDDPGAGIRQIQTQIEAAGCHVVPMSKLPESGSIASLREVAFFVLDWNLYGRSLRGAEGESPVAAPTGLKRQNAAKAIEFLKKLKEVCVAPVFIFTNEEVSEVEDLLKNHADLYGEDDPSHILVKSKGDVMQAGVFDVLSTWMKKAPSVYVLKKWERAYASAKNELFLDFYAKSVQWPLVLWKTYQDDNLSASAELGSVIGRNLLSRMTPFDFDLGPFDGALQALEADEGKSRAAVLKVLEGERFLPKNRLHGDSVAPGDVFKRGGNFYVNIRPDCDCIARDGITQVKVYLLKGSKITNAKVLERANSKYGTISESDTESVVFGMTGGTTVSFQFGTLIIEESGGWMVDRIGRLLPPYLTRLQQRYSAYLQRPGLSRIPKAALPAAVPVKATPAPQAVPVRAPAKTAGRKTSSRKTAKKPATREVSKGKPPTQ
ncbi:MAG: hypothetical protein WEB37_00025 [Bacteroidota bacterium]